MPLEPNQNATPDTHYYCTVSELFLKITKCSLTKDHVPVPLSGDC